MFLTGRKVDGIKSNRIKGKHSLNGKIKLMEVK